MRSFGGEIKLDPVWTCATPRSPGPQTTRVLESRAPCSGAPGEHHQKWGIEAPSKMGVPSNNHFNLTNSCLLGGVRCCLTIYKAYWKITNETVTAVIWQGKSIESAAPIMRCCCRSSLKPILGDCEGNKDVLLPSSDCIMY